MKKRVWRVTIVVSLWLALPCSTIAEDELRLKRTRELLRAYYSETIQSAYDPRPAGFMDALMRGLRDSSPEWRAFSCQALGSLGDPTVVSSLLPLLHDDTIVRGHAGDGTVAVSAAVALAHLGRSEGVPLLLSHTEKIAQHWHLAYVELFKARSSEDCGNDLDAWKTWFARE